MASEFGHRCGFTDGMKDINVLDKKANKKIDPTAKRERTKVQRRKKTEMNAVRKEREWTGKEPGQSGIRENNGHRQGQPRKLVVCYTQGAMPR